MEGEGRAGQLFGNYELFRDGDDGLHVADAGSVADVAVGHHVAVEEGKGHDWGDFAVAVVVENNSLVFFQARWGQDAVEQDEAPLAHWVADRVGAVFVFGFDTDHELWE